MRTVWITLLWVFTHVIYKSHSITFEIVNMPHLFTFHGLCGPSLLNFVRNLFSKLRVFVDIYLNSTYGFKRLNKTDIVVR